MDGMEKFPNFGPDYEILEELGRGTTGIVFKAWGKAHHRLFALKTIRPRRRETWETQLTRLYREVRSVACCNAHPNIVTAYSINQYEDKHFFVREFVEGETLQVKIAKKPFSPRDASEIVETLCQTVQFIHGMGMVHRNLTEDNVLLTADGTPKLIGFGKAKISAEPLTLEDFSIDIQALGKILFSLLAGKPSPPDAFSLFPDAVARICRKCWNIAPENQYHSAMELADDLRRYLQATK
jgi:serine/threonine protein kinase